VRYGVLLGSVEMLEEECSKKRTKAHFDISQAVLFAVFCTVVQDKPLNQILAATIMAKHD
jgi:hypothetical protein